MSITKFFKKYKKRYFIVFYKAIDLDGKLTTWETLIVSKGNRSAFPNREILYNQLKEDDPDIKNLVLTNLIEISRSEYENWVENIDNIDNVE